MPEAAGAVQHRPVGARAQATKTLPSVPTGRAVGVAAAVPETSEPFAVMQAQGMPVAAGAVQQRPVVAAAQATRTCPSVPTPSAEGVEAAVALMMSPLAVSADLAT